MSEFDVRKTVPELKESKNNLRSRTGLAILPGVTGLFQLEFRNTLVLISWLLLLKIVK